MFSNRATASRKSQKPLGQNSLSGTIARIIYHKDDFLVAVLDTGWTIVGDMPAASLGLHYDLSGSWKTHPKFGKQFAFDSYKVEFPVSDEAIRRYLSENAKWIGPHISRQLMSRYGSDALKICKDDPERVATETKGLSLARAQEISETLRSMEQGEHLSLALKELFLGIPVQRKALKDLASAWGASAPQKIKENPYEMLDVSGIGFITADLVAKRIGISHTSRMRLKAGLVYVLEEACLSVGHTCLPEAELIQKAEKTLGVSHAAIYLAYEDCITEKRIIPEDGFSILPAFHKAEAAVTKHVARIMAGEIEQGHPVLDGLAEDQIEAVTHCIRSPIFVLTGAPGTGKSYSIKRIIASFAGQKVLLAAPTGKAAKRILEHTGYVAHTIHKALEPLPIKTRSGLKFAFSRNAEKPLDEKVIVIDEVSMIDIRLFAQLLEAVHTGSRLILIGDSHQLPSISPGNVLRDMMQSGRIPYAELKTIKRQQPGLLLQNIHRVKDGNDVQIDNTHDAQDFFFISESSDQQIQKSISDLVHKRLPEKYEVDPLKDIQVISPFRTRTLLSCKALNTVLQETLNPQRRQPNIGKSIFRIGDKVINRKNNYQQGIINGDIGIVIDGSKRDKLLTIKFENPERVLKIPLYDNNLQLAYAITCHSYQGSEAPIVIIPLHRSYGTLLMQRNWIYTAISRAQRACIIIGERIVLRRAIKRNIQAQRYSRLADLLWRAMKRPNEGVRLETT